MREDSQDVHRQASQKASVDTEKPELRARRFGFVCCVFVGVSFS